MFRVYRRNWTVSKSEFWHTGVTFAYLRYIIDVGSINHTPTRSGWCGCVLPRSDLASEAR